MVRIEDVKNLLPKIDSHIPYKNWDEDPECHIDVEGESAEDISYLLHLLKPFYDAYIEEHYIRIAEKEQ